MEWLRSTLEKEKDEDAHKGRGFEVVKDERRQKAFENERAKTSHKANAQNKNRFNRNAAAMKRGGKRGKNAKRVDYRKKDVVGLPSTVPVNTGVVVYAELQKVDVQKKMLATLPQCKEYGLYGQPFVYDSNMNKVSCARPINLKETEVKEEDYTTFNIMADAVIKDIMKTVASKNPDRPLIVTTDELLSVLMTSHIGDHPWHINVVRFLNSFLLTKEDAESLVDVEWVSETAPVKDRPSEDMPVESERIMSYGTESTKAHKAFQMAGCTPSVAQVKTEKNPFPKTQRRMYRYRLFSIKGANREYDVLVRCTIDAAEKDANLNQFVFIRLFGLLEHRTPDTESAWRKDLVSNASTTMMNAFVLNSCKMTRWVALSLLADASKINIGFLARKVGKRAVESIPTEHQILKVETNDPRNLAKQLHINMAHLWAVADSIFDALVSNMESGERARVVKPSGSTKVLVMEYNDLDDDDEEEEEEEEEEGEEDEEEDDN
ncbi:translation initiation factor 3 subunit D [Strigomonas culicis]|uniref:Translation initiation factor 3 subunit D n=1 Tax=Strigomonas culicis TaxID=28005 RepID=S9U8B8_9TRYP|nr:translation initiation factor 3 subunit D [Strigomonas culicis]|eukprot:EPY25044.1 translation initiation factor 3 subunit D [Strigomonas culicis]